jgi:hypothetical protein
LDRSVSACSVACMAASPRVTAVDRYCSGLIAR